LFCIMKTLGKMDHWFNKKVYLHVLSLILLGFFKSRFEIWWLWWIRWCWISGENDCGVVQLMVRADLSLFWYFEHSAFSKYLYDWWWLGHYKMSILSVLPLPLSNCERFKGVRFWVLFRQLRCFWVFEYWN